MRPKIVEENIDNFNAVTKDAIARFVKLKEACGPNDHIPDLEAEISKWSTESKFYEFFSLVFFSWLSFELQSLSFIKKCSIS